MLLGSTSGQGPEISSHPEFDAFGYSFHEFIDQGGYGIVASVRHQNHPGILYARKQLSKSRIQREQLEKEIALIREANHRHVVHLVDNYEDKNWCYIVMLPLAAGNLHEYLRHMTSERPRDEESWASFGSQRLQLFQWIYCLAVTLKELHNRNIRHRDIKPQNILISGSNILLTDFGISFSMDGVTKVDLTTSTGTEKYEPPEALQESGDDTRIRIRTGRLGDIFSLGCVVFEMLEALSHPLLGNTRFPSVQDSYRIRVKDEDFISQVRVIKEHEALIKKLSEDYRFSGLAEALLGIVMTAMMTSTQNRKTSAVMVELLEKSLVDWHVPLLDCCTRRSGAEIEDRAFVEKNQSVSDHRTTFASLMTAELTRVHSEPEANLPPETILALDGQAGAVPFYGRSTSSNYLSGRNTNVPVLPIPAPPTEHTTILSSPIFKSRMGPSKIRPPRRTIQGSIDFEPMRATLRALFSAERGYSGSFEEHHRQVTRVFLRAVRRAEIGREGYRIVLGCVDEFVDYQTAKLDKVYSEEDHDGSTQGKSSTLSIELCECVMETWNVVNEHLTAASDVTMYMSREYCKSQDLPTLYKYGVERFHHQLSKIASGRIEEFIKSYQPDVDEGTRLQVVVEGCKEVFAVIQEISQQPNDYEAPPLSRVQNKEQSAVI